MGIERFGVERLPSGRTFCLSLFHGRTVTKDGAEIGTKLSEGAVAERSPSAIGCALTTYSEVELCEERDINQDTKSGKTRTRFPHVASTLKLHCKYLFMTLFQMLDGQQTY